MSASSDSSAAGTGPGGEIIAPDDWSEAETWAWGEIREGRIADFNERFGELDEKTPEGWNNTRKLGRTPVAIHRPLPLTDGWPSSLSRPEFPRDKKNEWQ